MHGAITERVGVRGSNQSNHLIFYPLILSFSRREKGRTVYTGMYSFHVLSPSTKRGRCTAAPYTPSPSGTTAGMQEVRVQGRTR